MNTSENLNIRKSEHPVTGITFSAFDLLHAGHIKMLEDAKKTMRLSNRRLEN